MAAGTAPEDPDTMDTSDTSAVAAARRYGCSAHRPSFSSSGGAVPSAKNGSHVRGSGQSALSVLQYCRQQPSFVSGQVLGISVELSHTRPGAQALVNSHCEPTGKSPPGGRQMNCNFASGMHTWPVGQSSPSGSQSITQTFTAPSLVSKQVLPGGQIGASGVPVHSE